MAFEVNIASGCVECIHQPLRGKNLANSRLISILSVNIYGLLPIKILVRSRSIRLVGGSVVFPLFLFAGFSRHGS